MPDVNALAREVQAEWDRQFTHSMDTALDYRMARSAVETALRAVEAERQADAPQRPLTFDLATPDLEWVLKMALEDFAARQRREAVDEGGNPQREEWADLADQAIAQVEATP